jgi:hypothetical protein
MSAADHYRRDTAEVKRMTPDKPPVMSEEQQRIDASLKGDGCTAKTILDQMDFNEAARILKSIEQMPNSGIAVIASGGGSDLVDQTGVAIRPYLEIKVLDTNAIWNRQIYVTQENLETNLEMTRDSVAPRCKQK